MLKSLRLFAAGCAALFAVQSPSSVAANPSADAESEARSALEDFHQLDQKLQNVGWRLARGNADYCAKTVPSIGLTLQDMVTFRQPDVVRKAIGLERDFAIQTVAARSPASAIGGLVFGREVSALDGQMINDWPAGEHSHWQRLTRAHDYIDAALETAGEARITAADGQEYALEPVTVCATRFELDAGSRRALAEGSRVVIGSKFIGFTYPEEEFAAAIAHELAHNVLAHRAWLDAKGRKRKNVRLTEREADRLMPWLLANAGYDPRAAHRFMTKWGPRHDAGIFRARTHDGWDERAEFIMEEIEQIEALMAASPEAEVADWRTHFRREIDVDGLKKAP